MRHLSLSTRRSASDAHAHATLMLRPHGAVPNWSGLNKTIRTLSVLRLGDTMVRLRGDTKGLWKGFVRRVCCALPLKCVFLLSSQKCVLHLWSLTGGRERKKKKIRPLSAAFCPPCCSLANACRADGHFVKGNYSHLDSIYLKSLSSIGLVSRRVDGLEPRAPPPLHHPDAVGAPPSQFLIENVQIIYLFIYLF